MACSDSFFCTTCENGYSLSIDNLHCLNGNQTNQNNTGNQTNQNNTGNQTNQNNTNNQTNQNNTDNQTNQNNTSNQTNQNTTGNQTNQNNTSNQTNQNNPGNQTNQNSTGNQTNQNSTGNQTNQNNGTVAITPNTRYLAAGVVDVTPTSTSNTFSIPYPTSLASATTKTVNFAVNSFNMDFTNGALNYTTASGN